MTEQNYGAINNFRCWWVEVSHMGTALEKEVNKSLEKTLVCLLRYKKKKFWVWPHVNHTAVMHFCSLSQETVPNCRDLRRREIKTQFSMDAFSFTESSRETKIWENYTSDVAAAVTRTIKTNQLGWKEKRKGVKKRNSILYFDRKHNWDLNIFEIIKYSSWFCRWLALFQ